MGKKERGLLYGLVVTMCLLLSAQPTEAGDTVWKKYTDAGNQAYGQAKYAEAEKMWAAALTEAEKFGPQDNRLATSLNNLAELYRAQGKCAEAEPLYTRALAIWEKALGPEHPTVATCLENYAKLLREMNRGKEAEKLEARAQAMRAKQAQEIPAK
jgi:tetratricopeptide (TPR) repeat protein